MTRFQPGDKVFGVCTAGGWLNKCDGAFAEYACTRESGITTMPDNVIFEEAGSAPIAALTALLGLRDKGQLKPGQKMLINGAAGGVGPLPCRSTKAFGAEVMGVCSRNMDIVRRTCADLQFSLKSLYWP